MLINNPLDLIGNTPLLLLNKLSKQYGCNIYLKLEKYNLSNSSKDRIVKEILLDAISKNIINKDSTIVEATSGNTGIALACICAILSLKCIIVMPSDANYERINILKCYKAQVILTDSKEKMKGCLKKVNQLIKENKNYYVLSQFINTNNYLAHYKNTAKEILDDLPIIDTFISSYGTAGTISGISKRLKEYNKNIKCISVILDNKNHRVPGVYSNIKSKNYLSKYIDKTIKISDVKAYEMQRFLTYHEGLFLGLSSSLNVAAALKYIKDNKCENVVIFSSDGGERYLSNKYLIDRYIKKSEVINDFKEMYTILFNKKDFFNEIWFKYHISVNKIKQIYKKLYADASFIYDNDPSCDNVSQVIESYTSFYAIFAYRIANYINFNFDSRIARIISEYAHSVTSIDIHPQANISYPFGIDHGAGIVIGQTCIIGKNVLLYHNVTLGAKSLKDSNTLRNKKRHPTIKNNVTIYCNSFILGGDTVIGDNCIIGTNNVITSSIKNNTIVKNNK